MQTRVIITRNGVINFSHVLKLTLTIARDGNTSPVGAMNDMMQMPYMYELTISLPGMFTIIASAPMIGMVNTAIPEVDWINREKINIQKPVFCSWFLFLEDWFFSILFTGQSPGSFQSYSIILAGSLKNVFLRILNVILKCFPAPTLLAIIEFINYKYKKWKSIAFNFCC